MTVVFYERISYSIIHPYFALVQGSSHFISSQSILNPPWFGSTISADSDTIYTIYLSFCTQTAVPKFPNLFRGSHYREKLTETISNFQKHLTKICE